MSDLQNTTDTNLPFTVEDNQTIGSVSGRADSELISLETQRLVWKALKLYATPGIALVGILGNAISCAVIKKDGLNKSCNILIFLLALTDLTFCFTQTDIPGQIFLFAGPKSGFGWSHETNMAFYCWLMANVFLLDLSACYSLTLPLLINAERILALFFPLKFRVMATARNTYTAATLVFVPILARAILSMFNYEHVYHQDRMFVQYALPQWHSTLSEVENHLTGGVFISLLLMGTLALGVKVYLITKTRAELTHVSRGTLRTTKMLIGVMTVYSVTCGTIYAVDFVRRDLGRLDPVLYEVGQVLMTINGSCNFFLYVFFNQRFNEQVLHLLGCRAPRHKTRDGKAPELND